MNEFAQFILERLQSMLVLILLAVPLLAGCLLVVYAVCKKKSKPFPLKKIVLWAALAGYLMALIFATLLRGMGGFRSMNLHLFRAWREAWNNYSIKNWLNVLLNVAMFIPFGFLLPLFSPKLRKWHIGVGSGFCLSLVIELIQLWRGIGVCDVDDLFANTLGTLIGYGLIMLIISLAGKGEKRWKRCLSYGLVLAVTLGSILGIFAVYELKEYGNIPDMAAFRANTSKTQWTLACQLPDQQESAPVYRTQTMTKEECDQFGAAFGQALGISFDEIMYYDKKTYFMNRGGEDGAHFLTVSYLDGSYRYHRSDRNNPVWVDADRETVTAALAQFPLVIPEGTVFSVDGDGWHCFTADRLVSGTLMYDGVIRCRYAGDGKAYRVENNLIAYTYYGETALISPEEAFRDLCAGKFSGGESFEHYHPEEVRVTSAALKYRCDTKGFYRPVYVFELVSTDGAYQSRVLVDAN